MIATYAQASDRQGLESAIDGVAIESSHAGFTALRAKGHTVANAKPIQVGGINVRYSRGVARLVFDDTDDDQDGSPITAVVEMDRTDSDPEVTVATLIAGVHAIRREVEPEDVRAALQIAAGIHESFVTRRRMIIAGGIVVVAGVVIVAAILIVAAVSQR